MTVVVARREIGVCRHEVEVEVPAAEVDAECHRVAMGYRRRTRMAGFRRGRVPLTLVRQYHAESIGKDVADRLAPKYWQKARDEEGLLVMLAPTVESEQVVPGRPWRFKVTVDVEPEVEIGPERSFDLPEPDTEPTESEIDALLEQVRLQNSTWVPVDRAGIRGDRVRGLIHRNAMGSAYDAAADDRPFDDDYAEPDPRIPTVHDLDIELGGEQVWPELTDNLTGLAAGGRATFERAEREGNIERNCEYEVEVHEVLGRRLPSVDDDWASGLAAAIETVDDLREQLGREVRAGKARQAGDLRTESLLGQLRERYPVTLPEAVIDNETRRLTNSWVNNLVRQGVDLSQQEVPWEKIAADIRPQAAVRAHSSFLLDRIARDDGIEATADDLERALDVLARQRDMNRGKLRRQLEAEGALEGLRAQIRRDLTVQSLLAANPPSARPGGEAAAPAAGGGD